MSLLKTAFLALVAAALPGCSGSKAKSELDRVAEHYFGQITEFLNANSSYVLGEGDTLEMLHSKAKYAKIFEDPRVLEAYVILERSASAMLYLSRNTASEVDGKLVSSATTNIDYRFEEGVVRFKIERDWGGATDKKKGFHHRKIVSIEGERVLMGVLLIDAND